MPFLKYLLFFSAVNYYSFCIDSQIPLFGCSSQIDCPPLCTQTYLLAPLSQFCVQVNFFSHPLFLFMLFHLAAEGEQGKLDFTFPALTSTQPLLDSVWYVLAFHCLLTSVQHGTSCFTQTKERRGGKGEKNVPRLSGSIVFLYLTVNYCNNYLWVDKLVILAQ